MMPFASSPLILPEDLKCQVSRYLPTEARVLAFATARVYHAPFGGRPDNWSYSGLKGLLLFGRDRITLHPDRKIGIGPGTAVQQNFWFRLIDLDSGKGIVWMHEISDNLNYHLDKPFFHDFQGKSRMFGFRFDDDAEAIKFHNKVTGHVRTKSTPPPTPKPQPVVIPTTKGIRGIISSPAPGSFLHVAHVGYDDSGHLEVSEDLKASWPMMLEELQTYGVAEKSRDFVDGFLMGAKTSPKTVRVALDPNNNTIAAEQVPKRKRRTIRRKPVVANLA